MLDVRVYRAAFLPALLALFVVAFSLEGRPAPLRTRAIADAFDPARAYGSERLRDSLLQLGSAFPERRPGSAGDAALADRVAGVFDAAGFNVTRTRAQGRTVDGETDLETVVGVRPGLSSRRIVVLAHRDSLDAPGLADLSGTAALLELARIFRTKVPSTEAETDEPGRALPLTVGEQGELNREGLPGVLLQVSGERGPAPGARISQERFTELGRAALRTVTALDEAGRRASGGETLPPFADEPDGIVTLRNVLPGWSVRLMVLCLLIPALLAALDAFFHARRHRLHVGAWVGWALAAGAVVPLA